MRFDAVRRLLAQLQASGRKTLESDADTASYTDSELEFGRLVLPLLEDMDSMKRVLEDLSRRAHALEVVLDRLPVAALILGADGQLLTMNRAARDLFGGPAITSHVLRAARRAAEGDEDADATLVPHPGRKGVELRLVGADVDAAEANGEAGAESPSVVFVVATDAPPPVIAADLVSRLGLTRTEAQVVAGVALGLSNKEVAERLDLATETARKHLQSAFRKTGARNRAGIVALAFGARFGQGPISGGAAADDAESA